MKGIDEAITVYSSERNRRDRLAARACSEELHRFLEKYSVDIKDVKDLRKISSKYCTGERCFSTQARKKQFDKLFPKFKKFLARGTTIIREYTVSVEIVCCLDTETRYRTTPKLITFRDEVLNPPPDSLGDWAQNIAIPAVEGTVRESGDDKCKALSPSLYLCDWNVSIIDLSETREL